MCNCITEIDKKLAERNGKVSVAFGITKSLTMYMRVLVATEKIDTTKRKPVPPVAAAYCPFCGEKQQEPA